MADNYTKRLVLGILAHVDAGKTTLSERILYSYGRIQKLGRVDKGDDGAAKLFGLLHEAEGLAVALRPRHTEVAGHVLFQRGTLAVADDGHGHPVEAGDAAQDGAVLPALTIAALLKERA